MLIARILEGSGSAASNASEYSWCILEGHSAAHSQYFIFLFSSLPSSFHYSFSSSFLPSTFIWSFYLPSLICCPHSHSSVWTPLLLAVSSLISASSSPPTSFCCIYHFFLHLSAFCHLLLWFYFSFFACIFFLFSNLPPPLNVSYVSPYSELLSLEDLFSYLLPSPPPPPPLFFLHSSSADLQQSCKNMAFLSANAHKCIHQHSEVVAMMLWMNSEWAVDAERMLDEWKHA